LATSSQRGPVDAPFRLKGFNDERKSGSHRHCAKDPAAGAARRACTPLQAKQAGRDGKYRGGWSPHCIHRFDPKLARSPKKNNLKGNCGSASEKNTLAR
jgi:hypothetical protein